MQLVRRPGPALKTAQQQAQYYHARKRQRARAEATAGAGGLRKTVKQLGLLMQVTLSTS